MSYLIAQIAVETGIPTADLLDAPAIIFDQIQLYLKDRERETARQRRRPRR